MIKKYGIGGNIVNSPIYGVGGLPPASKVYGRGGEYSGSPIIGGDFPSELPGLKLWCRYGSGITITGSGVSQWDDVSGNGNHLKQGTDLDRPQKQADGSILMDGIRQFLKADAFTLVQPETAYLLGRQITWTSVDSIFDGNTNNTGKLRQITASPKIQILASTALGDNSDWIINTYSAISVVFNGTSSLIQVDNNAPLEGDAGVVAMGGMTLGASGGNNLWSNIQVKECLIYSEAHDAAQRAQVINYLSSI